MSPGDSGFREKSPKNAHLTRRKIVVIKSPSFLGAATDTRVLVDYSRKRFVIREGTLFISIRRFARISPAIGTNRCVMAERSRR